MRTPLAHGRLPRILRPAPAKPAQGVSGQRDPAWCDGWATFRSDELADELADELDNLYLMGKSVPAAPIPGC